jgi:hypothetical protein
MKSTIMGLATSGHPFRDLNETIKNFLAGISGAKKLNLAAK